MSPVNLWDSRIEDFLSLCTHHGKWSLANGKWSSNTPSLLDPLDWSWSNTETLSTLSSKVPQEDWPQFSIALTCSISYLYFLEGGECVITSLFFQLPILHFFELFAKTNYQFSSVQFSRSVVYDSFWPHLSQHTRPPCPSPTPRVHSNSCPSSQWCHPAISSSVVPFSSCPQSLPASESFPMSQLFAWGGQSTGVSALASFLPKKSQGWSPSEWTGWISLHSKGLSRVFSNTTVQKHQFFSAQLSSIFSHY